eukprot:EG_transcript_12965
MPHVSTWVKNTEIMVVTDNPSDLASSSFPSPRRLSGSGTSAQSAAMPCSELLSGLPSRCSLTIGDAFLTLAFVMGGLFNSGIIVGRFLDHRGISSESLIHMLILIEFLLVTVAAGCTVISQLLLLGLTRCSQVQAIVLQLSSSLCTALNVNAFSILTVLHPPRCMARMWAALKVLLTFFDFPESSMDYLLGAGALLSMALCAVYAPILVVTILAKAHAVGFVTGARCPEWGLWPEWAAIAQLVVNIWALFQSQEPVPVDDRAVQVMWERVRVRPDLSVFKKFCFYHRRRHITLRLTTQARQTPTELCQLLWLNVLWALLTAGLLTGLGALAWLALQAHAKETPLGDQCSLFLFSILP